MTGFGGAHSAGGHGGPGESRPGPGSPPGPVDPGSARPGAGAVPGPHGAGAGAPEQGASPIEAEAVTILDDIVALEKERDEYLTALQRLQADFENFRKRVQRQQEEQSQRAALDLVGKLLPVLDTLDLAEAHLTPGEGGEPTHEGKALTQVRAQLVDALAGEGLERVDAAGVVFDPVVHDAVAHTPESESDGADGTAAAAGGPVVDEVLRSGYRWRGQVIRPAMVRVRG